MSKEVLPLFKSVLNNFASTHDRNAPDYGAQYALFAAWWFIENVNEDALDRQDAFFHLREIVRNAPDAKP